LAVSQAPYPQLCGKQPSAFAEATSWRRSLVIAPQPNSFNSYEMSLRNNGGKNSYFLPGVRKKAWRRSLEARSAAPTGF
jgi:hypothetical protein